MGKTADALITRALRLYQNLPKEQQKHLKMEVEKPVVFFGEAIPELGGHVIQFDTKGQEPVKVVSMFFGMDLTLGSRYVYLFPHDITECPV